ncbi:hypothetical protein LTR96_000359 [Exophiala xenobiotica]|uniref:Uncharacterized protein n=1 Tax=Vermiconidia calcicola TaxID=1690605 RepID=A0AAV9Q7D2_9PEZI|nr:hypothetical protein LTR41_005104 [Exophiala xenobiotica]KAK5535359.1 hypothetical protein LTR25_006367 [Vermiconidia calcicola]KAK5546860.1 hypothetical protein LTR23_003231 [Chaetothyriales sp. CCFEE 6169]KAK5273759.1 hypothetical protein LTR96_000359 [Exophiala xenobiotica]KAK5359331.1 hypothetical protein LTR11_010515 [Exophiala xenobiotica]
MSIPVGITVPKMLPVTGTFAPAFAAYYVLLNLRVSLVRQNEETFLGDQTKTSMGQGKPTETGAGDLLVAARAHSNFVENVPFALLMAAITELNGGNRRALTASLAALLCLRIAHAEFGIRMKDSLGWGRPVGYFGTLGIVAGMSSYAAYLVKSYWGF